MGRLFDLEAEGCFYTRLQNPTNDNQCRVIHFILVFFKIEKKKFYSGFIKTFKLGKMLPLFEGYVLISMERRDCPDLFCGLNSVKAICIALVCYFPADYMEPVFKVCGPVIVMFQKIGVFPDVNAGDNA